MPDASLCFCEMAIGNPMYREHTAPCRQARRALDNTSNKEGQ